MAKDIRLIGLDLDDTALNAEKEVTPAVRAAIEKAIAKGVQVLPATGRMLEGIPQSILAIPGIRYALTSNGAKVYDLATGTVLVDDCFTVEKTLELLAAAAGFGGRCIVSVFIDGKAYSNRFDAAHFAGCFTKGMLDYVAATRVQQGDLPAAVAAMGRRPEKVNLMFASAQERATAWALFEKRGDCTLTSSIPGNIELNTATANKGASLLRLAAHLGFGRHQVMAVGDGLNDIEMLRQAGHGVAMGGSPPAVLAAADAVTLSAGEDGVALAINKALGFG